MLEVRQIALDRRGPRRVRLFLAQPGEPRAEFRLEPGQAAAPAILAADHGGLDQELLPPPRRAQRALDHRAVVGVALRRAAGVGWRGLRARGRRDLRRRTQRFVLGRRPHRTIHRRRAGLVERRHLAEREVLREPPRREPLERAVDQREERAPRGVGPGRAPREPRGNAGPPQRHLEQRRVDLGRAQEHRHLVEGRPRPRLVEEAPRDLDRLPPLAGRREEEDVSARLTRRRRGGGEEEVARSREVGVVGVVSHSTVPGLVASITRCQAPYGVERRVVAGGDGHQSRRRHRGEGLDEVELGR